MFAERTRTPGVCFDFGFCLRQFLGYLRHLRLFPLPLHESKLSLNVMIPSSTIHSPPVNRSFNFSGKSKYRVRCADHARSKSPTIHFDSIFAGTFRDLRSCMSLRGLITAPLRLRRQRSSKSFPFAYFPTCNDDTPPTCPRLCFQESQREFSARSGQGIRFHDYRF